MNQRWLLRGLRACGLLVAFGARPAFAEEVRAEGDPARGEPSAEHGLRRLSYQEAIERALRDAPEVVVRQADVTAAQAQALRTRASWLPTLAGVATYTRLDGNRVVADRIVSPENSLNLSAQLVVPIVSAANWYQSARDREAVDVTQAQLEDTRRAIVLAVSRAYFSVLLEARGVEIALHAVELSEEQLRLAEARRAEGVGSRLEVVRAERELRANRAALASRRSARLEAQRNLGVLTLADGPVDALGAPASYEPVPIGEALESLAQRPDLAALAARAALDEKRAKHSYLDHMPTVSANGQAFYQNPPSVNFPETGWQVQVLLNLPIYDGGRRKADAQTRRADAARSAAAYRGAQLAAKAELVALGQQVVELEKAYRETEAAAEFARESRELSRLAFEAGTGTQIELIEAEQNLRDAETNAAVAETSWLGTKLVLALLSRPELAPSPAEKSSNGTRDPGQRPPR